jgi:hypothetical protein
VFVSAPVTTPRYQKLAVNSMGQNQLILLVLDIAYPIRCSLLLEVLISVRFTLDTTLRY